MEQLVERPRSEVLALIVPQTLYSPDPRTYDGKQLRSHFIYETFDIAGDAIVAFSGPVDVRGDSLVDLADKKGGLLIAGRSMLHFILESFGADLDRAVFMQRLLVMLAIDHLRIRQCSGLRRSGDDVYVGDGKLSVSIATVSGVSSLVHFGVNITNEGTPVKTAALADLGLLARPFAETVMAAYADEIDRMRRATWKVRSVS